MARRSTSCQKNHEKRLDEVLRTLGEAQPASDWALVRALIRKGRALQRRQERRECRCAATFLAPSRPGTAHGLLHGGDKLAARAARRFQTLRRRMGTSGQKRLGTLATPRQDPQRRARPTRPLCVASVRHIAERRKALGADSRRGVKSR